MAAQEILGEYAISTDPLKFDVGAIHAYLTQSYWSPGVPLETVRRAIDHSLCFAVIFRGHNVGFARVVTDRATFAYLADVYILPEHRGQGLDKWLLSVITRHPDLQGLRRFVLATRDAHELYKAFGFRPLAEPSRFMEIHRASPYAAR